LIGKNMTRILLTTILFIIIVSCASVSGDTLSLSGKVANNAANPLQGAIVSVIGQNVCDTTDAAGAFSINKSTVQIRATSNAGKISLQCPTITKGIVRYTLSADAPRVSFSLFALNGALVIRIDREKQIRGVYSVNLGDRVIQSHIASGMYLLV
jgi:hypothetical protein